MRDGANTLRRVGFAALFAMVASAAPAQSTATSQDQTPPACGTPVVSDDGWAIASAESVGIDGTRLCGIAARLKAQGADVHAVVIVRHGKLVFEQYYAGYDEPWGSPYGQHNFDATTKHDMRSASKSVVSLLVGIAIDRKLIAGVDEPVVKFFPEYAALKTAGWIGVTLRHLLTMSSGIQWDENRGWTDPANDEPHLGKDADPVGYVLGKPIAAAPDEIWNYNGGGTDLLGNVLERASGKPLNDFAREVLFEPLGITDARWENYQNGRAAAAAGLRLRPRDAAKIGQLVLDHGAWNGRQIVPAAWIAESVAPRFQAIGYFGGLFFYGYQWWLGRTLSRGEEIKWIAAMGLGGQRIFIVPDLDLVVMTTSGLYGSPRQGNAALDILYSSVIPSIRDNNTR
jgi:CubicO group peptidase (beta-lactamase class C family)